MTNSGWLLGSSKVAVTVDSDNVVLSLAANVVSSGWTLSGKTLLLGGVPVSLYEDINGYFAFAIWEATAGHFDGHVAAIPFYGQRMSVGRTVENSYALPISHAVADQPIAGATVFSGHRIGLTSENQIAVSPVSLGAIDEYYRAFINGTPFEIVRSGDRRYIAVQVR